MRCVFRRKTDRGRPSRSCPRNCNRRVTGQETTGQKPGKAARNQDPGARRPAANRHPSARGVRRRNGIPLAVASRACPIGRRETLTAECIMGAVVAPRPSYPSARRTALPWVAAAISVAIHVGAVAALIAGLGEPPAPLPVISIELGPGPPGSRSAASNPRAAVSPAVKKTETGVKPEIAASPKNAEGPKRAKTAEKADPIAPAGKQTVKPQPVEKSAADAPPRPPSPNTTNTVRDATKPPAVARKKAVTANRAEITSAGARTPPAKALKTDPVRTKPVQAKTIAANSAIPKKKEPASPRKMTPTRTVDTPSPRSRRASAKERQARATQPNRSLAPPAKKQTRQLQRQAHKSKSPKKRQLRSQRKSALPNRTSGRTAARARTRQSAVLAGKTGRRFSPPRYGIGGGVNRPPAYPRRARRLGWQGRVILRVRVTAHGRVETIRLSRSSGHDVLDRAALKAVRAWRFSPATLGPAPVAAWIDVPILFRLTDGS